MRVLPAVRSARWRSGVGALLDRSADACLGLAVRCMALRDRVCPDQAPSVPDPDAILGGILARLQPPAFTPSRAERTAAAIAHVTDETVWIASAGPRAH
jgi:hypothetical protein